MYQYHHAWYLNGYLAMPLLGLSQMGGDDTQKQVKALFIRLTGHCCPLLLFFVTASPKFDFFHLQNMNALLSCFLALPRCVWEIQVDDI